MQYKGEFEPTLKLNGITVLNVTETFKYLVRVFQSEEGPETCITITCSVSKSSENNCENGSTCKTSGLILCLFSQDVHQDKVSS